MTRGDGFVVADTDTGMMSDPKVLALARRMRDPARTAAALTLYDAVRLASWRAGSRLTLEDTAPGWWLDPLDDYAAALVAVGLLDAEHRIPEHAWEGWFGPARERRQVYRELGRRGGLAKAAKSRATAQPDAIPHAKANALADAIPHGLARSVPYRSDRTDTPSSLRSEGGAAPDDEQAVQQGDQDETTVATVATFVRENPNSPVTKTAISLRDTFGKDRVEAAFSELAREVPAGSPALDARQLIFGADRRLRPIPRPANPPRNGKARKGFSNLEDMERGFGGD